MNYYRVGRPVRIMLDRNEDMIYSGHRHPFLGKYKVGYTAGGKITALEVELFSNGGHSTDLSIAVGQYNIFMLLITKLLGVGKSFISFY